MTELYLYGGPLKSSITERAFGMCGQSTIDFALSAEEHVLGLRCQNEVAATFPATLGFNFPYTGEDGQSEDESGISAPDVLGFTCLVAQQIAQNIGKTFSPNRIQAMAQSALTTKYQVVPLMTMGRQTVRGAGNRYWNGPLPFFITRTSDVETNQ